MEKDFFRYCLKKFLKFSSICDLVLSVVTIDVVVNRVEGVGVFELDVEDFWRFFRFFLIVFLIPFDILRHRTTALLPSLLHFWIDHHTCFME